jgi:two-component system, LytTR family, sensor kinase
MPLIQINYLTNNLNPYFVETMTELRKISNYWWCQLAGWGIVALSNVFYAITYKQNIDGDFILRLIFQLIAGVASTHLLRWAIRRNNWLLLPLEKVIFRLSIAVILTTVLFSLIIMLLNQAAGLDMNRRNLDFFTRLLANIINFGIYIIPWVLIYYFYHYLVKSRKQELDTLKLEALVKELELKTIKAHINPHFIFNALNSIRALVDEDPARARSAVTHLSNILRSSMQAEKQETVPFEKELNIVKDYLALEHIRFEERLQVEYDIKSETLNSPVPPMMLQTLVENAIKHGIGKKMEGGIVKVASSFTDDYHLLEVQNSGILNGHANADGFGLFSTRNRLYLLFGDRADFDISQKDELVIAKILIPKV